MHYFIDAYNLLFRITHDIENLSLMREQLIKSINLKAQVLNLKITLVFDGTFQKEQMQRYTRFYEIEIYFSSTGETADDLILELVKDQKRPHEVTVVTSDKKLAWYARHCTAKTETAEQFLYWLDKRYQSRLKKKIQSRHEQTKTVISSKKIREGSEEYYLQAFQTKDEENIKMQTVKKVPSKKIKAQSKNKQKYISENDRWLKLFQKNQ